MEKNVDHMVLYSTYGCHLCEQAQTVIAQALGSIVREVDIAAEDALLERYGLRIPVLRRTDTGAELDWPFSPDDVSAL